jgi:hypothetical protein
MWKEAVMTYFKGLFQNLPGEAVKKNKIHESLLDLYNPDYTRNYWLDSEAAGQVLMMHVHGGHR